jgi:hypothetical protein
MASRNLPSAMLYSTYTRRFYKYTRLRLTQHLFIYFNATCFDRYRSSSGVLYKPFKIQGKMLLFFWGRSNIRGCISLWSRVLPEKPTRPELLKKFPAFYGTRIHKSPPPVLILISGSLSPRHGASSGCGWRNGFQIWRVAADSRQGVVLQLVVGRGVNNASP